LKEAQRALQEAREAAETASRMKSQFLAQVSHELRSPLNAVINFAQLLTSEVHGPLGALDYKVYANDIVESGQHLMDLIRELLDLAQAEAGRLGIREGIVNLAPIVQAVCRQMAPEAARSEVSLSHDEEAQLPRLRGDGDRLRQVLVNLVNNAIKFTAPGGHVRVRLVRALDGGVCLTVHDTGMGIPATEIERVMLPFEQMAACLADRNAGVGLGLPLARHLMELHGGALTLESETGVGTVATVTIPVDRMIL
jgi:signal transduction histidine kinase